MGFPSGSAVKNSPAVQETRRLGLDPWMEKNPWRRNWKTTPVVSPRKSHGERSLVGYSPWSRKRVRHVLATKQRQQVAKLAISYRAK